MEIPLHVIILHKEGAGNFQRGFPGAAGNPDRLRYKLDIRQAHPVHRTVLLRMKNLLFFLQNAWQRQFAHDWCHTPTGREGICHNFQDSALADPVLTNKACLQVQPIFPVFQFQRCNTGPQEDSNVLSILPVQFTILRKGQVKITGVPAPVFPAITQMEQSISPKDDLIPHQLFFRDLRI